MKIFQLTLLALVLGTQPALASRTNPIETRVFRISSGDMMYMYWNDANHPQQFQLFVDTDNLGKPADTVKLDCNGQDVYVAPSTSAKCDVAAHTKVSFTISKKDFKNGASGESKRWY